MQTSLKVVTIGSSATQYIFDSRTNPIFDKQLFEHILHIPYLSMMSFQNNERLDVQSNYARLHDSRNVINQILELLPDIVVIDFLADAYFGAVKLDNGDYITNNTWEFKDKFKNSEIFFPTLDDNYQLWKSHFTSFLNQLKLIKKDVQIVVNGARFPKYAIHAGIKENKFPKEFSRQSETDDFNQAWEKLDTFASTLVPVLSFDFEESFADLENPIKKWWFYYNDNYYQDAFIQLEDILRQKREGIMPKFKTRAELSLEGNLNEIPDVDEVIVSYKADTRNILSTWKNDFLRNQIQKLSALGYILHGSYAQNARFIKRKQFFTNKLSRYKDVFYNVELPLKKRQTSKPNKLLIYFLALPSPDDMRSNDALKRCYSYFFKTLNRSVSKDTIIVRVADVNLVLGSFYVNTVHFPDYEEQVQELIKYLMKKYEVVLENVVLYGISRGGTGVLIHSALGNYKGLAVDPMVNDTWYVEHWNDHHFIKGAREIDLVPKINQYLSNSKSKIYILGNQFIDITWPELLRLNQEKIDLIDINDETVTKHHLLSSNTVPEQLMYLNILLNHSHTMKVKEHGAVRAVENTLIGVLRKVKL